MNIWFLESQPDGKKYSAELVECFLGVGFTAVVAMIQTAQYSTRGVVLSVVCIVVGMPAFMFHIMKE